ncbi:APC family permease [Streptomyces mobaraensis NBRC 13819 = DSM 40847]|uniref:APC family permease n=2 Tax=Streptomyces mobaraensis TaxID=35621 RepID=A0A5N5VZQ6_STRMB|nr:APC family permease [Streptomyces mobaraensis]KAB7834273.1 APC family permease [Streptomyces mobaraensis]QTT76381.1 APC family permease [Streptomyces mobaraensis NBRC 13819 = DSM 40847]
MTVTPVKPAHTEPERPVRRRWRAWLLEGLSEQSARHPGPHGTPPEEHEGHSWWRVMCLTGVDYFSTLGYQPGIAALAAGLLSPLATLVLIALTLLGALPVYRRVARESPHGEGSIAMLERLLPWWAGKLFVLVLLGFAATDFMITITLSAADASAHVVENPFAPSWMRHANVWITLLLLAGLGAVFLKGFREAIRVAVLLVGVYLVLNLVVLATAVWHVAAGPEVVGDWWRSLTTDYSSPFAMIGVALLVFPRLALGMSGFETGVAVMPQIRGGTGDTYDNPAGRVRDTRRLLTTAALFMSCFLLVSSLATTFLIPAEEFEKGGEANGRALAYLAHRYLGEVFGTVYDVSTIAILWFAGASALAGLLNLVPRFLPRYGMAPEWTRAVRPLVLLFMAVSVTITILFDADVDAQGGAYATGVLVLILSASFSATIAARHRGHRAATAGFAVISAVFAYTLVTNVIERPDGLKIASFFIAGILLSSLGSRISRSFELRAVNVTFDEGAERLIDEVASTGPLRIIANEPDERDEAAYREKEYSQREETHIPDGSPVLFLEVTVQDSSDFTADLNVTGEHRHGARILRVEGPGVPNTIAAVLMELRNRTDRVPHAYFNWTEGHPLSHLLRFLVFGDGEVAPVTREVLRRAEPDLSRRPRIHVG